MLNDTSRYRLGLSLKLAVLFVAGTVVVNAPARIFIYYMSHARELETVHADATHLADGTVDKIEAVLAGVKSLPEYIARREEDDSFDQVRLEKMLLDELATNPSAFGATVAFEPGAAKPGETYFAPYAYRKDNKIELVYLGSETYRYHEMDWYIIPKELDHPVWSEPYDDAGGGNIQMITYSVPFHRIVDGKRVFAGVATVDVSLSWLRDLVNRIKILETGYAFIISQDGLFVSHPRTDYIMQEGIFSLAEEFKDPKLRDIGEDMIHEGHGFVRTSTLADGSRPAWLCYAPLDASGWSLGVVFPERELFAGIERLLRETVVISAIGFIAFILMIYALSTRFTRPLRLLNKSTSDIAMGDLDALLPSIRTHDEIGDLARSFERMRGSLKEYIANLTRTTAEKQRIESELNVAHNIQMSFLRKVFPPFPDKKEFDLSARLLPAKEVGGDLYDFQLIGDKQLFFCVGDVSDKGVPAALFMLVTQTLLRIAGQRAGAPDLVMAHVNQELADENESLMFVTAICGTLDYTTGDCVFSNAGHNPPLLVRSDGSVEWLQLPIGLVLGVSRKTVYQSQSIRLQPGDTLVMYTDGVTEAMNEKRELFSEQRLFDEIAKCGRTDPSSIADAMLSKVHEFVGTAPQSDDITILVLKYHGLGGPPLSPSI